MPTDIETEPAQRAARLWLLPALLGGLIVLVGIVALVLLTRPTPTPNAAIAEAPAAASATEATGVMHGGLNPTGPTVELLGLPEARTRFDAGTALFIDVRAGDAYTKGHIPGALTITTKELETRLTNVPAGTVIIAYGSTERPESGQRGAQIFMELGYPKVIALEGGFEAWRAAGHPVEP